MDFADKVAVITGGSRGIGKAIARAFALGGATTVLAARTEANLVETADEIVAAGGRRPLVWAADLATVEACEGLHALVRERAGQCDILVHSAGATRAGRFADLPDEAWLDGFALKFHGSVRLCRLFWPMLVAARGHVVTIIGGAGRTPPPDFLIGGSVNAALAAFTKGLSKLGSRDGVNVNWIHPGLTATERVAEIMRERAAARGVPVEQLLADGVAQSIRQEMVEPEDVAEAVLFLCGERARRIHGSAVTVDGGQTPGVY